MVAFILIAIWFGVFGYMQANYLTEQGQIFGWIPKVLLWKGKHRDTNAIDKVTWACDKCIAGFWCFWYIFVSEFINLQCFCFGLIKIFTISAAFAVIAAFMANLLTKILEKH